MKKLFFLLTAMLTLSSAVFSQKLSKVNGRVTDDAQKPVQGVTVSLYKAKDTMLVKAALTGNDGVFVFEAVKEGDYLVGASSVGYKKVISEVLQIRDGAETLVPALVMQTESKNMKELVITGKKPLFEQKADKLVVNVEASPTNAGANALEVLEKSPGVSVDKDGNISLKGKTGVQVFIDGKPAYLSGADLVNYLRSLQGSQLDQIEIMTNPPAKYDAAGNSGIINIKTKKTKQFGYNVTATVGYSQGIYAKNNQNINFNYRKNKVNLFGSVSRYERNNFQRLSIQRKFSDEVTKDVLSQFDQVSKMRNLGTSNNAKLGADYSISKKTTIGAVVNGFYNPGVFRNESDINIFDAANVLQSKTYAKSESRSTWKNISTNVNFRHQFDSTGKELTADVDYIHYNAPSTQNLSNYYFNANGAPNAIPDTLYGSLPQSIGIFSAKADYVHPLKKGAKFEAGIKISFVETDNNAVYDSLINNKLVRDYGRSNHFIYDENINAVYVNYSRSLSKKITGQFGLRLENTIAHGYQKTTGERFTLNYTQLFPTAYLQYAVNEKNNLSLNYGRRINRPDYQSLNPFVEFLDRYTFESGNPYLKPEFSHNVEMSYTYNNFFTTTLNYTKSKNIIQQVLEQNEQTNQTFIRIANIASRQQIGIALSAFKQIKSFSGNVYVNVSNNKFRGIVNNSFVSVEGTTAMFNASASYKFKKGWNTEISGFYRTATPEGVFRIGSFGTMSLGVSKTLLKEKATLRLSVRDVLWSQRFKGNIQYGAVNTQFQQYGDSRVASFTFTYRLSKGKVNSNNRRKAGGAGDEQNRVKGGGDN
ncbi:MAG: outer membrane beta-barrel family protein [Lacibacter sp.]